MKNVLTVLVSNIVTILTRGLFIWIALIILNKYFPIIPTFSFIEITLLRLGLGCIYPNPCKQMKEEKE